MKKHVLLAIVLFLGMLVAPASRACSYSIPGSEPANLLYEPNNARIFVAAFSANAVYVFGHNCILENTFSTSSGNPNGIAFDGTNLWISLYSAPLGQ